MQAQLVSVNVSPVKTVQHGTAHVTTAIYKTPVAGRVAVRGVNLAGDEQADRAIHGGPNQVAYAYAEEDYAWWETQLNRPLPPGTFGENLTTRGLDVNGAAIGEQWRIGSCVFGVTGPRVPCSKLAMSVGDPAFVRTFARALRPGAYLSVVEEGDVGTGDAVEVLRRPQHGLTIARMAEIYLFDHPSAAELLAVAELPPDWRAWAQERS